MRRLLFHRHTRSTARENPTTTYHGRASYECLDRLNYGFETIWTSKTDAWKRVNQQPWQRNKLQLFLQTLDAIRCHELVTYDVCRFHIN